MYGSGKDALRSRLHPCITHRHPDNPSMLLEEINTERDRAPRRAAGLARTSNSSLVLLLALSCSALLSSGCAGPSAEQHLAPLYTHISLASGGVEHEGLAGATIARRTSVDGPLTQWGLRPLFNHYPEGNYLDEHHPDGERRSRTQFLYPFGRVMRGGGEFSWWLIPITDYRRENSAEGRKWSLLTVPGIYLGRFPDGRRSHAWFPFVGHIEELFTWDQMDFVLWPLWMRSERQGRTTYHALWPFFSWTVAPDGGGWRAWPLVGHSWVDDRYDRWWGLWPIINYNKENLKASPRYHQTQWTIFPFIGHTKQGTLRSTSVLWPFFGYAHDSATGFWAWDGPWPLVRIMRPGDQTLVPLPSNASEASRTRFWPFWSNYQGDGLDSTWYAWPLINKREETYMLGHREALLILPFWQSFERQDKDGKQVVYEKLWPLYQYEREDQTHRYLFPQLNPLIRWPDLDENYSWMYELYKAEIGPEVAHERGFLGLWRRERDLDEERTYVSGLWSRRVYSRGEESISEQSLLFGLLRWRSSSSDGLSWLPPAVPGPGWPIRRSKNQAR